MEDVDFVKMLRGLGARAATFTIRDMQARDSYVLVRL
jgi:hypothetical protein